MAWRWCGFRRRALGCKSLHGAVLVAFTRLIRYSSSPLGGCPLLPDLSFAARPQPHCAAAAELVTGSQPFKSHVKSKEIGFGAVQFFVTFTPPKKRTDYQNVFSVLNRMSIRAWDPLGHFRMVIRTYPKGYYHHIYLHRFAVVLSTIQISSAVAARGS